MKSNALRFQIGLHGGKEQRKRATKKSDKIPFESKQ
jgi:hypothetical protein